MVKTGCASSLSLLFSAEYLLGRKILNLSKPGSIPGSATISTLKSEKSLLLFVDLLRSHSEHGELKVHEIPAVMPATATDDPSTSDGDFLVEPELGAGLAFAPRPLRHLERISLRPVGRHRSSVAGGERPLSSTIARYGTRERFSSYLHSTRLSCEAMICRVPPCFSHVSVQTWHTFALGWDLSLPRAFSRP